MRTYALGQTDIAVSAICLGVMPWGSRVQGADAWALGDQFREAGGNFFDTAHCYSFWLPDSEAGSSERALGEWVRERGNRDEIVVATKGAHPPAKNYRDEPNFMSQAVISADIDDSLERLGMDYIDMYWLHRDDPRVPVADILGWLNAEQDRGRIRAFGGSNWTSARLAEAQAYADDAGLSPFVGSQPKWSLLRYGPQTERERLEPGALLHLNSDDRAWHLESQLPVMCYGSTGNGFFATGGEHPSQFQDDENLARVMRCRLLADELGVSTNQLCLAWLRTQPFPTIPILGTANPEHLADALGVVDVSLSAEQRDWLERG